MAAYPELVEEIRVNARRFADGESSLDDFRRWFIDADSRAHQGVPSGSADTQATMMTDEIMTALSDLDDGLIEPNELRHTVAVIAAFPRGVVRFESQDTSSGHLYRRPASVIALETSFVPV